MGVGVDICETRMCPFELVCVSVSASVSTCAGVRVWANVLGNKCVFGGAGRGAGGVGEAEGGDTRACLHQEAVGVAVVAPVEFDHLLPVGVRTHETNHAHASLSP